MIRIRDIKIPVFKDSENILKESAAEILGCKKGDIRKIKIVKKSLDARLSLIFVYTVDLKLKDSVAGPSEKSEGEYINRLKNKNISLTPHTDFNIFPSMPYQGQRPVIIGSGPAGLFCALSLVEQGISPIIIERGESIEKRSISFVRFGEGGAGTFSDGKLNSSIHDRDGIIGYILRTFVRFGAKSSILYEQRPHIGTDALSKIIKNMHNYIEERGGEFLFNTLFNGFETIGGRIAAIHTLSQKESVVRTDHVFLGIGNGARDTFSLLLNEGVMIDPKPFAIGLRIMHPASLIDRAMYGEEKLDEKVGLLGHASYRLSFKASNGRGVYSFCMCPGGYVINTSHEEGMLSVNGMSFSDRGSSVSNAAIVATISPGPDPLDGLRMQREIEKKAFNCALGKIPYESFDEFLKGIPNPSGLVSYKPMFIGDASPGDISGVLPNDIREALIEGIRYFNRIIPGFSGHDALVCAVESSTSSPVRILRDKNFESISVGGLYPIGEGAGYAGGIISSAADGIKAAMKITRI